MRNSFLYLLIGLSSIAADDSVVTLTGDTFPDFADKEELSLIKFYAPWCGHCKKLAPEYQKAASTLLGKVKLAKVDCDVEKDICAKAEIRGYPTLKVYNKGVASDYKGPREADGIVGYMTKLTAPAIAVLTKDSLDAFIDSDRVVVVASIEDDKSSEFKVLETLANKYRVAFRFGNIVDKEAFASHSKGASKLVLFKKFDERKVEYVGPFEEADISAFIDTESIPLMDEIDTTNYSKYVEAKLPLAYLFYSSPEERASAGAEIESAAKAFKGKINFVYIDANTFGGHASNLNIEQKWPAFVIHDMSNDSKYPYPPTEKLVTDSVTKYLTSFVKGELKPFFKSEAVPENNNGPVKIVVGSEYHKIVMDKEKDVLLDLYAPWCGHCKKLAPIYEQFAKLFPADSKVVIASMDAVANDLPQDSGFTIEGYPTIKLFKAGSKEVVDYRGGHDIESLTKFVKENAVNHVDLAEPKEAAEKEEL